MGNRFITLASFSCFLAIAIGAFASHALQDQLNEVQLSWIEQGWRYQVMHSLALLALGFFVSATAASAPPCRKKAANLIGFFWTLGIIGFSFGLYALALGASKFHLIIPMGGTCFLIGWAILLVVSLRSSFSKNR